VHVAVRCHWTAAVNMLSPVVPVPLPVTVNGNDVGTGVGVGIGVGVGWGVSVGMGVGTRAAAVSVVATCTCRVHGPLLPPVPIMSHCSPVSRTPTVPGVLPVSHSVSSSVDPTWTVFGATSVMVSPKGADAP
jgi:hypothetical protein